jgi:hypothetical protein
MQEYRKPPDFHGAEAGSSVNDIGGINRTGGLMN